MTNSKFSTIRRIDPKYINANIILKYSSHDYVKIQDSKIYIYVQFMQNYIWVARGYFAVYIYKDPFILRKLSRNNRMIQKYTFNADVNPFIRIYSYEYNKFGKIVVKVLYEHMLLFKQSISLSLINDIYLVLTVAYEKHTELVHFDTNPPKIVRYEFSIRYWMKEITFIRNRATFINYNRLDNLELRKMQRFSYNGNTYFIGVMNEYNYKIYNNYKLCGSINQIINDGFSAIILSKYDDDDPRISEINHIAPKSGTASLQYISTIRRCGLLDTHISKNGTGIGNKLLPTRHKVYNILEDINVKINCKYVTFYGLNAYSFGAHSEVRVNVEYFPKFDGIYRYCPIFDIDIICD